MALIIGCDPSAKKIALVAKETLLNVQRAEACILYKGSSKQTPESIHAAMEAMWSFLSGLDGMSMGERFAWVESPLVGRGGVKTTMKQAFVGGVIRACLVEAGFKVYDVHPSTWRAGLGIKARTTDAVKAETARTVQGRDPKIYAQVSGDSDLTDAAAIALYGEEQVRKASALGGPAGLAASSVRGSRPGSVVR